MAAGLLNNLSDFNNFVSKQSAEIVPVKLTNWLQNFFPNFIRVE